MLKRLINALISSPRIRYSLIGRLPRTLFTEREEMLDIAMRYVSASKIMGDYVEFGVYKGKTFASAYHLSRPFCPDMRFLAFDSFEGLPDSDDARKAGAVFEKGDFSYGEKEFRAALMKKKVDLARVTIVPGWFKDTLTETMKGNLKEKKAALVYVDCDVYESAVSVLDFIGSFLQDGTLLIFDECFTQRGSPKHGEQRAFREWLAKHPEFSATEYRKFWWSGNSFIVHRNDQKN